MTLVRVRRSVRIKSITGWKSDFFLPKILLFLVCFCSVPAKGWHLGAFWKYPFDKHLLNTYYPERFVNISSIHSSIYSFSFNTYLLIYLVIYTRNREGLELPWGTKNKHPCFLNFIFHNKKQSLSLSGIKKGSNGKGVGMLLWIR